MAPFCDARGGRAPTAPAVAASARAGADWASNSRDLPDPLGWADIARSPAESAAVIRQRALQGRLPQRAHRFPLPKAPGHRPRTLLLLDHFDDLLLRTIAGRVVPHHRFLYDRNIVLSAQVDGRGPGWRVGDHRRGHDRRRRQALEMLQNSTTPGMGVTDTKDYYASVDHDVLHDQLMRAGCPPGAVSALHQLLSMTAALTGVGGLPIGSEASAFLGNVYLAPADKVFSRADVVHYRWTDDIWAFPPDEATWRELLEEYESALNALGLTINRDKTDFLDSVQATHRVQNPVVDYMLGMSSGGHLSAAQAADELAWMLFGGTLGETIDVTAVRFCLGVLRSRTSPLGIEIIENYPELFDREPTAVGQYLAAMAVEPTCARSLDHEWLFERANRPPTSETMAAAVQSLRVLSRLHLERSIGDRLLQMATSSALVDHVPLQQWAAYAWHRSEGWKPNVAGSAAEAAGHLAVKRSFTAGLRKSRGSRTASKCLDRLGRQEPELAPTIAWAR